MKSTAWLWPALICAVLSSGCVTRRYLVTSDPPGAIVYANGQYLGPTPVESPFIYYGKYRLRIVKDGYEPLDVEPELIAPWYQWPGLDFVFENLIPYPFRDVQPLHFQLAPLQSVRQDDVRNRAEQLRQRGAAIQTPPGTEGPAPRIQRPGPAPGPVPMAPPTQPVIGPILGAPSPGSK